MYISENLIYRYRPDLKANYFEHIWADVKVGAHNFTITCLYRPPNETVHDHELCLTTSDHILNSLCSHNTDNKIIASDLNFGNNYSKDPILPPKPLDRSARDIFASFGFTQLID